MFRTGYEPSMDDELCFKTMNMKEENNELKIR